MKDEPISTPADLNTIQTAGTYTVQSEIPNVVTQTLTPQAKKYWGIGEPILEIPEGSIPKPCDKYVDALGAVHTVIRVSNSSYTGQYVYCNIGKTFTTLQLRVFLTFVKKED
jgi:hypothetical protein